ncbi:hypothetical protein G9A89_013214 [Geosiphon pyriformis]|nr:hypothetical protein G9A89_013214 [Geosiphon pyriformis]
MCNRFIKFFGGIHGNRVNKIITDFGLSNGYRVHDGLDQNEVKRHEHLCGYQINTNFMAKTDRVKNCGGMVSFFAASAFVNDTIWIGDCQTSMQYALNIASEFFSINDISINNEKTMAISINQGVQVASLSISGRPISIAKKDKTYHYLEIFLSMDGLSKPSVAKVHSDVRFFVNIVLKKTIMNKQFSYLVLAVLQSIDVMIKKSLKIKACLLCDFPDAALHHSLLYGLKFFEQLQSESKLAAVVFFSNAKGILGHLFNHRFLDLQIVGWAPLNPLQFSVKLCISLVNNFLAGVIEIFLHNELSLANNLPSAFCCLGAFLMSSVLGGSHYFDLVCSLKCFGIAFADRLLDKKGGIMNWKTFYQWKRLDLRGPTPYWFDCVVKFLVGGGALFSGSSWPVGFSGLDVLGSEEFSEIQSCLYELWSNSFEVFTNSSLINAESGDVGGGAAAYFSAVNLSISVKISGLLSSTLTELQAVVLALECVLSFCTVVLYLDSQAAINACVFEVSSTVPDFCVPC